MIVSYAPHDSYDSKELIEAIEDAFLGDRSLFGNLPYGQKPDINRRHRLHGVLLRLAEHIGNKFVPPAMKAKVDRSIRFGNSPFTTGVVHCDYAGPPHRDTGNMPGTLTALAVVRRGRAFPKYGGYVLLPPAREGGIRRIYEMPHGSTLVFDGSRLEHEVTPSTVGTRWSVIFHARIGLKEKP